MEFAIRIRRMTSGSTKAVTVSSPSSNSANTCKQEFMRNRVKPANYQNNFYEKIESALSAKSVYFIFLKNKDTPTQVRSHENKD